MNSLNFTNKIMNKYNIKANKKYGQNFLINDSILENISNISELSMDDLVIEIGPGLGNLTEYIIDKVGHMILVEIDKNMIDVLTERFMGKNYTLLNEDILNINIDEVIENISLQLGKQFKNIKLIANLPYYITTPIIFKILEQSKLIDTVVIMVQKEVAERIVAKPRTKDYGILTIMVDYYADSKIEIIVPNSCFIPAPNVTSAVVSLKVRSKYNVKNTKIFYELVHKAFEQRRKKLSNSLTSTRFMNMDKQSITKLLESSGLGENCRAEEISVEKYVEISNML
ncbi:MAG: 16S rRNA (adenine(1518)-N(6)/adenine(1519)-N(6))-dimethyltransferase RsmA [Clostridia bacterium]|nr:16S rRNA (adenine(1518)-N(6)/adenine(1519)-N(6))-dimethyltransferase RsmA [Clostridia bacterium]